MGNVPPMGAFHGDSAEASYNFVPLLTDSQHFKGL